MRSKDLYPRIFGRHAEAYKQRLDDIMSRGEARGRLRMLELAGLRPGMRILDLACGPGTMTRLLAAQVQPAGHVLGVDLAPEMIEVAMHDRPPGADYVVMDIEHLGFAGGAFDAVVCGHGLQFAPDLARALVEARRVLRPGGALAASVPAPAADNSVWDAIDAVVDRYLPLAPRAADDARTLAIVRDAHAFEAAALAAGYASARVESVEEMVAWESAELLVSMFMGWWQCAARVDALQPKLRQQLLSEATEAVRRNHPGAITTRGRNLVLAARNG